MGKAAVVEFEGTRYTLSLISWGILRRTMQGAAAKAMMGVPFVPGYELAVWQVLLQICRRGAVNSLLAVIRLRLRTMTRSRSAELPYHWQESV